MQRFNDHVAADERTVNVTVPMGDGLTFITLVSPGGDGAEG